MSIIEIVILGIALSMDAFAVTISNVFCYPGTSRTRLLMLPAAFGLFQGLMPLLGFFLGGIVGSLIEQYAGIVTFVILGFIGGNMAKEGISDLRQAGDSGQEGKGCPPNAAMVLTAKIVLVQAFATSIDAFAVGVSLRAVNVEIVSAAIIIALTTFVCCLIALFIGRRFGKFLGERAQIVGGVVLILIGLKALIS